MFVTVAVVVVLLVGAVTTVLWAFALGEVVRLPDAAFVAAGTSKGFWVAAVAVTGPLGATAWWSGPCFEVRDAHRNAVHAPGVSPAVQHRPGRTGRA